jgi:hypothetical protein
MTKIICERVIASVINIESVRREKYLRPLGTRAHIQKMFSSVQRSDVPCRIIPFPIKRD